MKDFTVKYYDAAMGGNDITVKNQVVGTVYVVITADSSDSYWTGRTSDTNHLYFTLNKVNLSTITTLSGLDITADSSSTYDMLFLNILKSNEFDTRPLSSWADTIVWYSAITGGNDITVKNQVVGTVYVVITADSSDSYWTGSTSDTARIAITLK